MGGLLTAQTSFPLQLMTPLVIMALLVSMLLKNAQDFSPTLIIKKLKVGARFYQICFTSCATLLAVTLFLDFQWLREGRQITKNFDEKSQATVYEIRSKIVHPEIVMALRFASIRGQTYGRDLEGVNFILALDEFWPNSPVHITQAAQHFYSLKNIKEFEKWSRRLMDNQPEDSLLAELFLLEVYKVRNNFDGVREVYDKLRSWPEHFLAGNEIYLSSLITLSAVFKDYENTPNFYRQYVQEFKTSEQVETNMAIYYLQLQNYRKSLPHMRAALALNPEMENASRFKAILSEYSDTSNVKNQTK
jgi:tetratricopeptide (TPR) repeat protein